MRNVWNSSLAVFLASFLFGLTNASYAITNGGFETGFSGWSTTGITNVVGLYPDPPPEGAKQALIETGDTSPDVISATDLEAFLGLSAGSLAGLGNGTPTVGSAIKQTFTANGGDVLSFDWSFLTNETPPPTIFNDFSFVSLLLLSTLGSVNSSPFVPFAGNDFDRLTEFQKFTATIPSSGTYQLGLGVVHVEDNQVASGLLIDNVVLTRGAAVVPEPNTLLLFGSGLISFAFWRCRQSA